MHLGPLRVADPEGPLVTPLWSHKRKNSEQKWTTKDTRAGYNWDSSKC